MEHLARWPLLLAAVVLAAVAVGLDMSSGPGQALAVAAVALASACLGAFLYAEGARHREWWDRPRHGQDGDDAPPTNR